MKNYFNSFKQHFQEVHSNIFSRKDQVAVKGFCKNFKFYAGDALKIVFFKKNVPLVFEGICLAVRKRKFKQANVSFYLRNILFGIGVEVVLSYFSNRAYSLSFFNFKRKLVVKPKSKQYYLRSRLNRESRL